MMNISFHYTRLARTFRNGTCLLLSGLLAVGSPLMAAEPTEVRTHDVALNASGLLNGTVLNTEAQPIAGVAVNVLHNEHVVAKTVSNEEGKFTVKGLRNGAHVIEVGQHQQRVRLWGTNTAPPAAIENVAIVVDEEAVRGQMFGGGGGGGGGMFGGGGLSGGAIGGLALIGAATAITLGTTLDNNATPASP